MKKYLICLILALYTHNASALTIPETPIDPNPTNPLDPSLTGCAGSKWKSCPGNAIYDGCSYSACVDCEGTGVDLGDTSILLPNSYGIVTSQTKQYETTCPTISDNNATCTCQTTTTYSCGSGYYGTATSERNGCTKCPSNATCDGGNGSTFLCDKNYYKNGTTCTPCPSSGITDTTGVTDITKCYITTFSDSTGSGIYTSKCYYTK